MNGGCLINLELPSNKKPPAVAAAPAAVPAGLKRPVSPCRRFALAPFAAVDCASILPERAPDIVDAPMSNAAIAPEIAVVSVNTSVNCVLLGLPDELGKLAFLKVSTI